MVLTYDALWCSMMHTFVSAVACTHSVLCIVGLVNSWAKLWTLEGNGFREHCNQGCWSGSKNGFGGSQWVMRGGSEQQWREYYWYNTGMVQEYCIVYYMCSDSEAVVKVFPSTRAKHVWFWVCFMCFVCSWGSMFNALWGLKTGRNFPPVLKIVTHTVQATYNVNVAKRAHERYSIFSMVQ